MLLELRAIRWWVSLLVKDFIVVFLSLDISCIFWLQKFGMFEAHVVSVNFQSLLDNISSLSL